MGGHTDSDIGQVLLQSVTDALSQEDMDPDDFDMIVNHVEWNKDLSTDNFTFNDWVKIPKEGEDEEGEPNFARQLVQTTFYDLGMDVVIIANAIFGIVASVYIVLEQQQSSDVVDTVDIAFATIF